MLTLPVLAAVISIVCPPANSWLTLAPFSISVFATNTLPDSQAIESGVTL